MIVSPGAVSYESAENSDLAISQQDTKCLIPLGRWRAIAWRDNVFVERLWRSVKYEEVYLRAYETVGEARHSIGRYLCFYNARRPISSLDDMTPDQAYFQPSAAPRGGLISAEAPLIDAESLFRQAGPALRSRRPHRLAPIVISLQI